MSQDRGRESQETLDRLSERPNTTGYGQVMRQTHTHTHSGMHRLTLMKKQRLFNFLV